MTAHFPPDEATPRRLPLSIGSARAVPLGLGDGVRGGRAEGGATRSTPRSDRATSPSAGVRKKTIRGGAAEGGATKKPAAKGGSARAPKSTARRLVL
jgi:hypothetical protein